MFVEVEVGPQSEPVVSRVVVGALTNEPRGARAVERETGGPQRVRGRKGRHAGAHGNIVKRIYSKAKTHSFQGA